MSDDVPSRAETKIRTLHKVQKSGPHMNACHAVLDCLNNIDGQAPSLGIKI